jgi:hypothetical protein
MKIGVFLGIFSFARHFFLSQTEEDQFEAKQQLVSACGLITMVIAQFTTIFNRRIGNILLVFAYICTNSAFVVF